MRYLLAVLAFVVGAAGMVAGEADDSPGLQLIGVLIIVVGVALLLRRRSPA